MYPDTWSPRAKLKFKGQWYLGEPKYTVNTSTPFQRGNAFGLLGQSRPWPNEAYNLGLGRGITALPRDSICFPRCRLRTHIDRLRRPVPSFAHTSRLWEKEPPRLLRYVNRSLRLISKCIDYGVRAWQMQQHRTQLFAFLSFCSPLLFFCLFVS